MRPQKYELKTGIRSFLTSSDSQRIHTQSQQIRVLEKIPYERYINCRDEGELMKLPCATVTRVLLSVVPLTGRLGTWGQGHATATCHLPN